jgi:hypothetical protein
MGGIPRRGRTAPMEVVIEISEQNQRCGDQGAGSHQQSPGQGIGHLRPGYLPARDRYRQRP